MSLLKVLAIAALAGQPGSGAATDLDLYARSLGHDFHAHPNGTDGWLLERAERSIAARLARLMPWLRSRYGSDQIEQARCAVRDCEGTVDYARGPTLDEEWRAIRNMRSAVQQLERRQRASARPH
jgi:hypothetical protein